MVLMDKATNQQIMNILKYDNSIPNDLLKIVVVEALNRKLLEGHVKTLINSFFGYTNKFYVYNVSYEDVMQEVYITILKVMKSFKGGAVGFIYCFPKAVKRMLIDFVRNKKAQKNTTIKVSIHEPIVEGFTLEEILSSKANVEKYVIRKLDLQERLERLDEQEKKMILMYANGFNISEIGRRMDMQKLQSNRLFHRSIKIMRGA